MAAGIARRYATALFELAEESDRLERVEQDMNALAQALRDSADLRAVVASPIYGRDEQGRAMAALAAAMDLSDLTRSTLGLMAEKRRLFALGELTRAYAEMMAERRGEVTAEVAAAAPLSEAQIEALSETLRKAVGKDVKLNVAVDEDLIGGLVVKVGSKMIDTSIRSKLAALQNVMKEVG
jgi:F-type H+-transporting ATPase subunit delta